MNIKKLPLLLLIFACFLLSGLMSLEVPETNVLLKEIKQDFLVYVPVATLDKPLIAKDTAQQFYRDYLSHYFSPWKNPALLDSENKVRQIEESLINQFTSMPGWGENHQLHTKGWVDELVDNMNLKTYPNHRQSAITISVAHLRKLPTVEPSFKTWGDFGDGYPFDRLTASLLPANLPIKIVHISKDGAWALVLTPYKALGWLPFNDFAFVDQDFMRAWQTGHYAAIVKDKVPLVDLEQHFLFFGRIGSLHPMVTEKQMFIATMGVHHQAVAAAIGLDKDSAVELPISLTGRNLAKIANVILGQPYDWGGYYGYRDCSATIMDLFTPFGIWLPRSSVDQAHAGKLISLENLDNKAKQALIRQQAVPFLTLLSLPGHIALYLGEQEGRGFVYQTSSSMPIEHWLKGATPLPLGKTVITPLDFGEDFPMNAAGFLKRVSAMTVLGRAVQF